MYELRIVGNTLLVDWQNETFDSVVTHITDMHKAGVLDEVQVLKEKGPDPIKLSLALCNVMGRVFSTLAQYDERRGGYVVQTRLAGGPALDTVLSA